MATQVIVVDDDPIVGNLTLELLKDAGYEVRLITDSLKALQEIKNERPALVVLDILMPGIDGLTLLHRLKSDPATAKTKAIIVSGKSFAAEKERARQYGAALFIEKPYDVSEFAAQVAELLKADAVQPAKAEPAPTPAPAPHVGLKVAVWGCRAPGEAGAPASPRYGRRTSCVSIELAQQFLIFDAGSGIDALGDELTKSGKFKELWLFLTHFHRDHVEGLAAFPCARDASYTLNIAGTSEPDKPLDQALADAFMSSGGAAPTARIELYEMIEQTYEIMPGVRMTAFYANHPGATMGYILQTENRRIAYCPDSEVYGEAATALQDYDEKLGGLVHDVDLLVHDGRFTDEDYKANRNTGHSSFLAAVDFAGRYGIKQLVLVHQDARYSDDVLDEMSRAAQARVIERGYKMTVSIGREGLRLSV